MSWGSMGNGSRTPTRRSTGKTVALAACLGMAASSRWSASSRPSSSAGPRPQRGAFSRWSVSRVCSWGCSPWWWGTSGPPGWRGAGPVPSSPSSASSRSPVGVTWRAATPPRAPWPRPPTPPAANSRTTPVTTPAPVPTTTTTTSTTDAVPRHGRPRHRPRRVDNPDVKAGPPKTGGLPRRLRRRLDDTDQNGCGHPQRRPEPGPDRPLVDGRRALHRGCRRPRRPTAAT